MNAVFYPQNTEAIDELIRLLQREYIVKDPYAVEYEEALVHQMMITASRGMRLYQKAAEEPAGLYQEFQELRLKMLSHYEKDWTTEKLCQMANMEKSQFYSYYKQFFSSTPHSDLIEVQIRHFPSDRPRKSAVFPICLISAAISNATADVLRGNGSSKAEKA